MVSEAAKEKLSKALDIRDKVAEHQPPAHDPFAHHIAAPLVEAVNEVTNVQLDEQFATEHPSKERLEKGVEAKDRLARNGLAVSEEEELWHEELEEGIKEMEK